MGIEQFALYNADGTKKTDAVPENTPLYGVTEEQLETLIYHHQELIRCAFQKYSTANAQINAENALESCKSILVLPS